MAASSVCPAHSSDTMAPQGCPAHENYELGAEEVIDESKLLPIPKPAHQHYFGLMGHLADLDRTLPVRSYWQLMDQYSPIFQLDLGMQYPRVFVGSRDLVNEMADDSRFTKFTHRLHQEMRPVFGDGLFSAESTSKAWGKAHRVLVPALGPIGLRKMFDDMMDISAQLILMWDRLGPEQEIELIEDMSRLTFDTIGLCAYGYRFNQFYSPEAHPFRTQLQEAIVESGRRANRPDLMNQYYYYKDEQHRQENIVHLQALCRKIIQERLEHPKPDAKDLLNIMLHAVDRETGEQLGVDNVMYQIPTLLGGGYETTSSTLCFIYYFLCSNPATLRKAQQEVDTIVGDKVLTYDMLRNLKYLDACMKEGLRMQHPVSLLTRFSTKDTVIGGRYLIKKGQMVSGIWRHYHRDPRVWGEDADEFRPERMLDVNFQKMPPNSWKPFGDGLRACIGRGFAEQEILINLAMVLQKFNVELVNPTYKLELKGQMGVKPVDFKIRVRRRPDRTLLVGIPGGTLGFGEQQENSDLKTQDQSHTNGHRGEERTGEPLKPVAVFFGGNQGTAESLGQAFARTASDFGLEVVGGIQELDVAVDNIPTEKPVIIITASYEGRPPYNAKKFVSWIEDRAKRGAKLAPGVKFAVFGVGNSDWVHTFHRIPRLVDETLEQLGAERIVEAGYANVKRDAVGPWEGWSEMAMTAMSGITRDPIAGRPGVQVKIDDSSLQEALPEVLGGDKMEIGLITENRELADTSVGAAKRHVDVLLPKGSTYQTGDCLMVLGRNTNQAVARVMKRFGIASNAVMSVSDTKKDYLPSRPIAVEHFLRGSVELAAPITQRQLTALAAWATASSPGQKLLEQMREDAQYQILLNKRYSLIDVLDEVPTLQLPFGVYIDLLQPLSPRYYSIASSSLDAANQSEDGRLIASLTLDVFEALAMSGHGMFHGVASYHVANCAAGDSISCLVRPTKVDFRLPKDPSTPIIMLAAGSGIAPMRAFIQERAAIRIQDGAKLGPAVLFFGCRHPDKDYIYRSELEAWQKEGIVELIPCFSKPGDGIAGRYVPEAMSEQRERIWDLFQDGAVIYTCGSAARLGRSTTEMWQEIWMDKTGKTKLESHEWLDQAKGIRYISDVY